MRQPEKIIKHLSLICSDFISLKSLNKEWGTKFSTNIITIVKVFLKDLSLKVFQKFLSALPICDCFHTYKLANNHKSDFPQTENG